MPDLKLGIAREYLIELLAGFGIFVRVHQREGVVRLHDGRERIESERQAELVEALVRGDSSASDN